MLEVNAGSFTEVTNVGSALACCPRDCGAKIVGLVASLGQVKDIDTVACHVWLLAIL